MAIKPFGFTLAAVCTVAAVGLDVRLTPGGKQVTRRSFTEAELKRALGTMGKGGSRAARPLIDRLRARGAIQGPPKGPFALTEHGQQVVDRSCALAFKRRMVS